MSITCHFTLKVVNFRIYKTHTSQKFASVCIVRKLQKVSQSKFIISLVLTEKIWPFQTMAFTTLCLVTFLVTLAHGEGQYYYGDEIGDPEAALDHYPQYHYHATTNKNGHSAETALDHYHYYDTRIA